MSGWNDSLFCGKMDAVGVLRPTDGRVGERRHGTRMVGSAGWHPRAGEQLTAAVELSTTRLGTMLYVLLRNG